MSLSSKQTNQLNQQCQKIKKLYKMVKALQVEDQVLAERIQPLPSNNNTGRLSARSLSTRALSNTQIIDPNIPTTFIERSNDPNVPTAGEGTWIARSGSQGGSDSFGIVVAQDANVTSSFAGIIGTALETGADTDIINVRIKV